MRLLRQPLLHCFLLGGLLWLAVAAIARLGWLPGEERVVTLSQADLRQAQQLVASRTGRAPEPQPVEMALRQRIDQHILVEEAVRLGLHRRDPVARRRMVDNMRLVYGESAPRDAQLLREAEALGMPRQDLLLRRRLVELMQRRFAGGHSVPDDATLATFVAGHSRRFGSGERFALEQRWFRADADGAEVRARQALERLRAGEAVAGDPHPHGTSFERVRRADLQRLFGPDFATVVEGVAEGRWEGPVRSAHGWHLVRVIEREAARPPALDDVRRRAVYAWNEAQREARIEEGMQHLRSGYRVLIGDVAPWM